MVHCGSFPDVWIDLFQSDQPLDMDAILQSDLFASKRNAFMKQLYTLLENTFIIFSFVTQREGIHDCDILRM